MSACKAGTDKRASNQPAFAICAIFDGDFSEKETCSHVHSKPGGSDDLDADVSRSSSRRPPHRFCAQSPGLMDLIADQDESSRSPEIGLGSELSGSSGSECGRGDSVHKGQVRSGERRLRATWLPPRRRSRRKKPRSKAMNGAREEERAEALAAVMKPRRSCPMRRRNWSAAKSCIRRDDLARGIRALYARVQRRSGAISGEDQPPSPAEHRDSRGRVRFRQADLRLAQANEAESRARYEKTFIKRPSTEWFSPAPPRWSKRFQPPPRPIPC